MYSKELVQKVIELRKTGLSRKDIAEQIGLTPSKIKYILSANDVRITKDQLKVNLAASNTSEVRIKRAAAQKTFYELNPDKLVEVKNKRREALRDPLFLQQQSERSKEKWRDPEYAALISKRLKETFSLPEIKLKLSQAHKGSISPNNAVYTFGDIYKICDKYGLKFIKNYQSPKTKLYKSKNINNEWPIQCSCGNIIYPDISILARIEVPKSCGCKKGIAETEIRDYIKQFSKSIEPRENRDLIAPFGLDIVDPTNKVAVEYCGLHWHSEEFKTIAYHYNKYLKCQEIGYRLITLFEDEWLTRRIQVEGFLRSIFDKNSLIKADARKLKLELASKEEAREFTNSNHIQEYAECPINYKLSNNDGIIALASFSKRLSSRQIDEGAWELHRYVVKIGLNVRGGCSKIIKRFKTEFNPIKIISYSDNRWSNGNLYEKIGFLKTKKSNPSYWYIKKNCGTQRFHKSYFKKERIKILFPEIYSDLKTESEMMKTLNYKKIWDCGKIRWELIF